MRQILGWEGKITLCPGRFSHRGLSGYRGAIFVLCAATQPTLLFPPETALSTYVQLHHIHYCACHMACGLHYVKGIWPAANSTSSLWVINTVYPMHTPVFIKVSTPHAMPHYAPFATPWGMYNATQCADNLRNSFTNASNTLQKTVTAYGASFSTCWQ